MTKEPCGIDSLAGLRGFFRLTCLITAFFLVSLLSHSVVQAGEREDLRQEAIDIATQLYQGIRKGVIAAKAKGDLASAIKVCEDLGPTVARDLSQGKWFVGRTSLKVRRGANASAPWEVKVMREFERRHAQGEAIQNLEYDEIVNYRGRTVYRFMKALPTKRGCLKCHGKRENLEREVRDALDRFYPEDMAVGFELGDIRGALSLEKTLSE